MNKTQRAFHTQRILNKVNRQFNDSKGTAISDVRVIHDSGNKWLVSFFDEYTLETRNFDFFVHDNTVDIVAR